MDYYGTYLSRKCKVCGNFHDLFADCPRIDEMVNRFLAYKLPLDFNPDCGISFDGRKDDELNKNKTWPTGTNLFNAEQAEKMIRYLFDII